MEQRRVTDPDKIEDMIAAESDPKDRMFLLILNNINKALVANTTTIKDVSDKLDAHLTRFEDHAKLEEAMVNQGKGAGKVVAWVLGIVQVIGLAIWVDSREEISAIHAKQHEAEVRQHESEARIVNLENIMKGRK